MPPRELPDGDLDTDNRRAGFLSPPPPLSVAEAVELAQAEAARAEAARSRAIRLRQQAEAASIDQGDQSGAEETGGEHDAGVTSGTEEADQLPSRPRLYRPSRKALAIAAAVMVICASLTASGYLAWQRQNSAQQRQRAAEFSTAARNAVVMMMSIDPSKARDDIQRFADQTTGILKVGTLLGAEDLVKEVEQSRVSSKCAVQASAVESMTKDSAVVLVAAKSEITKPDQATPESRSLRVVVHVARDGGQLKVSRVEIVP